jgi:hypothetical protein
LRGIRGGITLLGAVGLQFLPRHQFIVHPQAQQRPGICLPIDAI